jgi:hypothetical protein
MAIAHDNEEGQCTTMRSQGVAATPNNHDKKNKVQLKIEK